MRREPQKHSAAEIVWRRPLTPIEEAEWRSRLGSDAQAAASLHEESELTRLLGSLPDAPVSSNFTARVLDAVERDQRAAGRHEQSRRTPFPLRWLPKAALAGVFLFAGALVVTHERQSLERKECAQSVATVSEVASLPSPEILQNFEAIRRLNQTPRPDEELLTLLQ
ncbi:MAG TPA: hypothetical protein VHH88_11315 [Verrucomicrobiae bacterium]|nr:hypothetical protein [Verrucomicrobiae bacterium]